ncbi:hypothetical protein ABIF86_000390 [Bradyrhizobium japonicum]
MTQADPFLVKELKRAQALSEAREIFRGEPTDSDTQPLVLRDSEGHIHATGAVRTSSTFESRARREAVVLGRCPILVKFHKQTAARERDDLAFFGRLSLTGPSGQKTTYSGF